MLAAAVSAAAGLVAGVATNLVTGRWSWTWAAALAIAGVLMIGTQVWLATGDRRRGGAHAAGAGSVAVAGSVDGVQTDVELLRPGASTPPPAGGAEATASGAGSVAVGGDARRTVRTRFRG